MPFKFATRLTGWLAVIMTWCAIAGTSASADDAKGCQDTAGFKRFEGSRLVLCDNRKFDKYELATGKAIDNEDYSKKIFEAKIDLSGKVEKNLYLVPRGPSEAEVFANYADMLAAQGFTPLFKAGGEEAGRGLDFILGKTFKNIDALMGFHEEGQQFGTFAKKADGLETYVTLFVVMGEPKSSSIVDVEEGEVLARVDVIYAGKMADQMVLVKASDMKKAIDETGRINLYGILFDFNKSDIKPESRAALDEIGKYLKEDPERKLRIVGHTDGVGGADFNVKLSQARATAVVSDLVATYGIAKGRLASQGAGMAAPIASNDTDEGRAKNRRVELVAIK